MDVYGLVHLLPGAGLFTGVMAKESRNCWKRQKVMKKGRCLFKHSLFEVEEEATHVHIGWAPQPAWWMGFLKWIKAQCVKGANPNTYATPSAFLRINLLNHRLTPSNPDLPSHPSK